MWWLSVLLQQQVAAVFLTFCSDGSSFDCIPLYVCLRLRGMHFAQPSVRGSGLFCFCFRCHRSWGWLFCCCCYGWCAMVRKGWRTPGKCNSCGCPFTHMILTWYVFIVVMCVCPSFRVQRGSFYALVVFAVHQDHMRWCSERCTQKDIVFNFYGFFHSTHSREAHLGILLPPGQGPRDDEKKRVWWCRWTLVILRRNGIIES